ncbi:MAG: glycosyltransferase, partial [Gammaproteobacteria bacterium]|nr:glycosyltransferase [Gammaproteobacteria bacterium]
MRLVLAGGGTGGHIVPNVAIIQELKAKYNDDELELLYIGSRSGMEKQMMKDIGIPYKGVFCGKLRRYFSWENFLDVFKIPVGILQAFFILMKFRPKV